jgi:hypothetical protein
VNTLSFQFDMIDFKTSRLSIFDSAHPRFIIPNDVTPGA